MGSKTTFSPNLSYAIILCVAVVSACNSARTFGDADDNTPVPATDLYLYVSSGACYTGGVAASTGLGLISKYRLDTGELVDVVADYSASSTTDFPADLKNFDADNLLVLIENATTTAFRRVDLISKRGVGVPETLSYGSGAFTGILRAIEVLSNGSFLTSRSTAVSKLESDFDLTATGFINAPAGACATSTTLMSDVVELSSGKLLFAHAAATPNNKLGLMSADGLTCLAAQAGPVTTALPTDILVHSSGNVLVAYGSATAGSNSIYSYVIDQTANTFTAYQSYFNSGFINGPTRMVEDVSTGDVYVSNGAATLNTIEKFNYNAITKTLTRAQDYPFVRLSGGTRCVSGMVIAE